MSDFPIAAQPQYGFTLLELLIVLSIIAVLAVVSITSYTQYTARANRADAKVTLAKLAQKQERYFTQNQKYLTEETLPKASVEFNITNGVSEQALYDVKIDPLNVGYKITATAREGGRQYLQDTKCRSFSLDHTGKQQAADKNGADTTSECWGR